MFPHNYQKVYLLIIAIVKKGELIMAKQKKLKEWITVAAAVILVILLSAGTSIIVNKQGAVQSSAKIKNGLSA